MKIKKNNLTFSNMSKIENKNYKIIELSKNDREVRQTQLIIIIIVKLENIEPTIKSV